MKKLKEENIDLLQRKRVIYILEHNKQSTPSKENVVKEISKDMKVDRDLIKIRHIYPHFGVEKAKIIAHIYKTKEALKRFEKINKKKKKEVKKKEAPKAEEKSVEKIKEEKPKEVKTEVKESGKKKEEKQENK